jgi:hypothetical protein
MDLNSVCTKLTEPKDFTIDYSPGNDLKLKKDCIKKYLHKQTEFKDFTIHHSPAQTSMIKIIYPDKKPTVKTDAGKEYIFCVIRKRWLLITPEEWVRQNVLLYITEVLNYPASLIAVEKQLQLGELNKRFDIVVYKDSVPFVLIECKEMNVPINQKTLDQVMRYNINLQAVCFIITNGTVFYGFKKEKGAVGVIDSFPSF